MKELRDLLRDPRSVSRVRDVVRRSRAPSAVSRGTKHTATPARAHSRRPSHASLTPARSHRSAHSTRRHGASKTRRASKHASKRRERSRSKRASRKPSRRRSRRHSSQRTSDSEVSDSLDDSEVSLATPSPDRKRARSAVRAFHDIKVNLSFDGADWYSFINHFELLARKHGWDEQSKALHLVTALKGRAQRATRMKGIGK